MNEYGEKNNLKVSDDEVKNQIQKQIQGMPGQEKMVIDYKNLAHSELERSIYEEKFYTLLNQKLMLLPKRLMKKLLQNSINQI